MYAYVGISNLTLPVLGHFHTAEAVCGFWDHLDALHSRILGSSSDNLCNIKVLRGMISVTKASP
jgi:hypothetical protein